MACDAIVQYLETESGRYLQDEVYRRVVPYSPIIKLMAKDVFPEGLGEVISNLTYERTAPTDAVPSWTDVTDDNTDGGCLPTPATIAFGSTTRTFNLQKRAVNGPDFCAEALRTKFALEKQLSSIAAVMAEYARIEWEIRYRTEYQRLAGRKVAVGTSFPMQESSGSGFPATCPTSQLTQGVLNFYRTYLIRDGAAEGAMGTENGSPILTLYTSPETSDSLIFQNADIRQDLRWGKPNELLAPFGVERSYRGFYHLIDHFLKRYSCAGGVYTEIAAWDTAAASKGNKSVLRSAWLTASIEASWIFDRTVMTARIPRPVVSPGAGFKFDPLTYMGDFRFKNILNKECNPDGTIIFPRAIFAEGSEPVHPERGVVFAHLRCDPAVNAIQSCT